MALTLSTAARNAACDAVVDLVDGGAGAGKVRLKDVSNNILCTITLADPAFGAAGATVAGRADGTGLPKTGTGTAAAGAGTNATQFDVVDSNDTVIWSGSVTATGGGGDLTLDNVNIAEGQTVSLGTLTHTQPAS